MKPPILPTEPWRDLGLTLLELLVVIAVLAILAVGLPGLMARPPDHAATVRELVGTLREARANAVFQGKPVDVVVDARSRRYGIGAPTEALPEGTSLTLTSAREIRQVRLPAIRFFTDGSASGGRIVLVTGGRSDVIEIGWLTGRISRVD